MASEDKEPSKDKDNPEVDEKGASVSNWFSGWYDTAKKKLAETNEFMKHDLQEFTQAVQHDASKLVAVTATTMKEKLNINVDLEEASAATRVVKDSLSNLLGNIASKVGPIRPDDDENAGETAIVGTLSGAKVLSPSEARLYAIRTDPATFCNEPDNEKDYHVWLPRFDIEEKNTEISSLMLDCSQIRSLHTKLVPSAVSHSDFWARYFFKLHLHENAEERRAMLVERVHKPHDDIEWDDEDDDWVQPKNIPMNVTSKGINAQEPLQNDIATEKVKKEECSTSTLTGTDLTVPEIQLTKEVESEQKTEPNKDSTALDDTSATKIFKTEIVPTLSVEDGMVLSAKECTEITPKESPATEASGDLIPAENGDIALQNGALCDKIQANTTNDDANKNVTGKSTAPSSGESSDDWEKDFDLDMTEDEIQQALMESDAVNVDDIAEDWDDWE